MCILTHEVIKMYETHITFIADFTTIVAKSMDDLYWSLGRKNISNDELAWNDTFREIKLQIQERFVNLASKWINHNHTNNSNFSINIGFKINKNARKYGTLVIEIPNVLFQLESLSNTDFSTQFLVKLIDKELDVLKTKRWDYHIIRQSKFIQKLNRYIRSNK